MRGAEVAGPEAVAPAAVLAAGRRDLGGGVYREAPRALRARARPPVRVKSLSSAKPLPAVPWQRFAPLRSGPAVQVSSPPASRSASSASSRGSAGERGHDAGRAVAPLGADEAEALARAPSGAGGQFAARPPGPRWPRAPRCPGDQLRRSEEVGAARERGDDAGHPVGRAEDLAFEP